MNVLEESLGGLARFRVVAVELREPEKAAVLAHRPGAPVVREAFVVLYDPRAVAVHHVVVSLAERRIVSRRHVSTPPPGLLFEELSEVEAACKADDGFRAALEARGISDMRQVTVVPLPVRSAGEESGGRRLVCCLVYASTAAGDLPYAHPVANVCPVVDLGEMRIARLDEGEILPVLGSTQLPDVHPAMPGDHRGLERARDDRQHVDGIGSGPCGLDVMGHEVRWHNWHLRVGFTAREGVVLHDVRYEDAGRLRRLLFRASLAGTLVSSGDELLRPDPEPWPLEGTGSRIRCLTETRDWQDDTYFLDVALCDMRGRPRTIYDAVALQEREAHMSGPGVRTLAIVSAATVSNYEYEFTWLLHRDGTLEFDVVVAGTPMTRAARAGERPRDGQLLRPGGLYAPFQQHLFKVRLDVDVDGAVNTVYETVMEIRDKDDLAGGDLLMIRDRLVPHGCHDKSPNDTTQLIAWKVVNPTVRNVVGEPVGYRLIPAGGPAVPVRRANVSAKGACSDVPSIHVTPYTPGDLDADEIADCHCGGPALEPEPRGRPLVDKDIVLWHTFGIGHMARLEDWPRQSPQRSGFRLEPCGFFDCDPPAIQATTRSAGASTGEAHGGLNGRAS